MMSGVVHSLLYCTVRLVYRFSRGHYSPGYLHSHVTFADSLLHSILFPIYIFYHFRFGVARQIALSAEPAWAPPADAKWEEKDFEGEIQKLEKEADERMDAKIAEMMSKIDNTGL
jgi:hypothetical protein